ncbi:MAG: S8 family peptidase [Natronosporangium sp.]
MLDQQLQPDSIPPELLQAATSDGAPALTLVTGDKVQLGADPTGQPTVEKITAASRPDGRTVTFHTITRNDQTYVVPADALALLGRDLLDWELFNLAELAKLALGGTVGSVPVIVTHLDRISTQRAAATTVAGTTVTDTFEAINATSMQVAGTGQWWQAVQAADTAQAASASSIGTGALAGVKKIWLSPLLTLDLADSVPQIGAPQAWAAGYDGTGVTVAVLDTGIDPNHPDVTGKIVEQLDFTGSEAGPVDGHGHGTHVAATIAGTGTAPGGLRPGVAPGAQLRIGKVCGDSGGCPGDAILAGMEWAAMSGATVVNMSLGGGATDGTDPLSMMVNRLTQQYGTLFSIAAGNAGPDRYTVGAPGAADAALTVAAIDKSDQMAEFSSRGPRVGDHAAKPDLAAPGVGIIAARAAGTAMGTVVDDFYTAASGTSMATPHVTGAVAVAAQRHPDLSGPQLKHLLMGTAYELGHHLYAQGSGRVDVDGAVDATVYTSGSVGFGRLPYLSDQPATRTITLSNATDAPVTVSLTGSLADPEGNPAVPGLLTLSSDQVTVPANGQVPVEATVDSSVLGEDGAFGVYLGSVAVTGEDGEELSSSRLIALLEPPRYPVTVNLTLPDGAQDAQFEDTVVMPMDNQEDLFLEVPVTVPGGENGTTDLFRGSYTVHGVVSWLDPDGVRQYALPVAPEVTVTDGPVTVDLDLTEARRAGADIGTAAESYSLTVALRRTSDTALWSVTSSFAQAYQENDPNVWVLPTGEVETGRFEFTDGYGLVPPSVTMQAVGAGSPIQLEPRYGTPDVSVDGPTQFWRVDEQTQTRDIVLPIPRLDTSRPTGVVYAGAGTAEEFGQVDAAGKLALITPADACPADLCDFEVLRDRIAIAAAGGATGVLVAGQAGRIELGTPATENVDCGTGPDSCPEIEPYAALPVVSVLAGPAGKLISALQRRPDVLVITGGTAEVQQYHALAYHTEGQVPAGLPRRVSTRSLDRVEHQIHGSAPGQLQFAGWTKITPPVDGVWSSRQTVDLPKVSTNRTLTTFVGPGGFEAIDRFSIGTRDYAGPMLWEQWPPPGHGGWSFNDGVVQDELLSGSDTLAWNTGPSLPGAVKPTRTESGFSIPWAQPCAGCREGDTFWPTMYVASTSGGLNNTMIGVVNDQALAGLLFLANICQPPRCETTLYDQAGNEIEQQLVRVEIRIGQAGNPTGSPAVPLGGRPSELLSGFGAGLIQKGANQ